MNRAPAQGLGPGTDPSPGQSPAGKPFIARGNEPGWRLEIGNENITLDADNGKTRVVAPRVAPETTGNTTRYAAKAEGRPLTATITDRVCADNMSGMPHPKTVTVQFGDRDLKGCGGEPAELLQGAEWVVESISGAAVAAGSRGTLNFSPDGNISGRSFCNNYRGSYKLTGESLTTSLMAATLMACDQPLMNQERQIGTWGTTH